MHHTAVSTPAAAPSLDGLWVLLVDNEGEVTISDAEGKVPMMARAGVNETYLLGFKNMGNARKFIEATEAEGAVPRMVVKGNKGELLKIAQAAGVTGLLLDYDPNSDTEPTASPL